MTLSACAKARDDTRLPKATVLLRVSTLELRFELRFLKIHQSKGFREKKFIYSHVQKFTPPVSAFMFLHLLSNTLTSKSFTFSRIKKREWLRTGCLSEILPNCVRVVLYEWHLVNYNICLFLVHNLRTSVRVNRDGEGEIWSWRLLVLNSCQNDNACEPSYTKSKVYNMDKAE